MVVRWMYSLCIWCCWVELTLYNELLGLFIIDDDAWSKKCQRPIEVLRGIFYVLDRRFMPEINNRRSWRSIFRIDFNTVGFIALTSIATSLFYKIFGYAEYVNWWIILIPAYVLVTVIVIGVIRIYRSF